MRATVNGRIITLTLSERNLLALLAKLKDPTSYRTLVKDEDGVRFIVQSEPDNEHYLGRPEGPAGAVHPRHLATMTELKEGLEVK